MKKKMLPPSTYLLRSHMQESATADSKPKQQALDKKDCKYAADKMIEENVKSTVSTTRIEQETDSQTGQSESSKSNSTPEVAMPIEYEASVEKEDRNNNPSKLSELNSSTVVEEPTESQIPAEDSNKIMDQDKNQDSEIKMCPIPMCKKKFERCTQLTEHLKTHCTDQTTCPVCKKVLNSSNSRDRHLLVHSKERPYECTICSMTFTTNGNMHRHAKRHLVKHKQKGKTSNKKEDEDSKGQGNLSKKEEVAPQVDVCEGETETPEFQSETEEMHRQNYFQSLGLRRKSSIPQLHINEELISDKQGKFETLPEKKKKLIISDEGRIVPIPHSTTQTGSNLRSKQVKENPDAGSSKINSNSIHFNSDGTPNSDATDAQDLAGIIDIISNVQPKTSIEDQITTDTSSVGQQYIKHSVKQSFACENCKYTARDKNSLKRHQQTHNRDGKFKCKTCDSTFTYKANGQRHVKEKHSLHDRELISDQIIYLKEKSESADEKIFNCKYCPCTFDNEQALQHHKRSNECKMKPYFCAICDIGSSTKNNCFRHIEKKHPEIFTNQMTSEEKNKVKELNMKQTIYISPRQDEDKSEEIEAAEGLCRLSEYRQDDTFMDAAFATKQFHDTSCNRLANLDAPLVVIGTGTAVIAGADAVLSGPSKTTGTVSSMTTEISMSMIKRTSPSVTKSSSEFLEDQPLDLSVNPLDLSFKSFKKTDTLDLPESNLETESVGESQMTVSESNRHSQSVQNFSKDDYNLQQQKCVVTKQSTKNFICKYCEKTFYSNSNLQRHLVNVHKQSSIIQLGSSHNPIRRDLLRECSINSSIKHSDCNQIKNSKSSLLINSKFNASYDRGTGSDTENDLASIPSIQSTVNQGIHYAHPCISTVYSVISHINRKRPLSDLQSSDFSFPTWNQRKKHARTGSRSPTEAACSPVSVPRVDSTSTDRLNDEASIGGSLATNPGNITSAYDFSQSTHDQSFNVRPAESAEPSPSKHADLICRYCSSQFSSKEHVDSHIKELHYLEHNNTQEVPDEKIRWKKERFSKLRQ